MIDALHPGRKVRVYFNLHRKCWSVQDAKTRRVIAHTPWIKLVDASFVVSQAGRARVLREQKKNVHAFVVGTIPGGLRTDMLSDRVSYNPYKAATFMRRDGGLEPTYTPVTCADVVLLDGREVLAQRAR